MKGWTYISDGIWQWQESGYVRTFNYADKDRAIWGFCYYDPVKDILGQCWNNLNIPNNNYILEEERKYLLEETRRIFFKEQLKELLNAR